MPILRTLPNVAVSSTAVIVAPANPARKKLIISQTTANAVRIGASDVVATTGLRLGAAGAGADRLVLEGVDCPTDAIYAIREGGSDGAISGVEIS